MMSLVLPQSPAAGLVGSIRPPGHTHTYQQWRAIDSVLQQGCAVARPITYAPTC
jgi:hypothetical protein